MKKKYSFLIVGLLFWACESKKKPAKTYPKDTETEIPVAIRKLIEAAKKDSNNELIQMQLVNVFDSIGKQNIALQYINKLISIDSLNGTYWLKRGQICKQVGDTVAAIKSFQYAARIYPTPMALMELANLYAETKNNLAIAVSNQLMKMNPSGNYNAQAYFFMGVYWSKMNSQVQALAFFDKSIEEDFHFEDAYIEKGYLYYNDKKYKQALAVFEQLTLINQSAADGYYWQAKCNEAMGNKAQAISLYNKTLTLNSTLVEAQINLNKIQSTKP